MHFSIHNMTNDDFLEYSKMNEEIKTWKESKCLVYIINMYDENDNWIFTKVGKSKNLLKRFQTLERQYYIKDNIQITHIEPICIFKVENDDLAQALESFIRYLFKKTREFIPNDRFKPFEISEEEWKELERYYELVCVIEKG